MVYYYHGTTLENLPSIAKYGLRPRPSTELPTWRRPRIGPYSGTFISDTERKAANWGWMRRDIILYGEEGTNPPNISSMLLPLYTKEYQHVILRFGSENVSHGMRRDPHSEGFVIREVIAPEYIEVKYPSGSNWFPIKEFVRRLQ